jgi:hypothetical protein
MTTYPLSELLTSTYRELKALGATLGHEDQVLANALLALEQPAIPGAAATLEVPYEPIGEEDSPHVVVGGKLRKLQAVVVILAEAKRPDLAEQVIADIDRLHGLIEQHAAWTEE